MDFKTLTSFVSKNYSWLIPLLAVPYCVLQTHQGGDFRVYLAAAGNLKNAQGIYNTWFSFLDGKAWSMYGYSPTFATMLIPATFLPSGWAQFLFLIADVFMLFRIISIFYRLLDIESLPRKSWWLLLLVLFTLRFILHNFEMVQLNIFILFLSIEGLYQIFFRHRIWLGSLLIAMGANFKLLPLVFIPYLLWRMQWKALGGFIVFSVVFLLLPALFFGFEGNLQLHRDWWEVINPMHDKYNSMQNVDSNRIHGLGALFAAYFSKNNPGDFQFLITELNVCELRWLLNGARLLLMLLTFYFFQTISFQRESSQVQIVYETAYIFLITPLIFPQQNKWAYVNILPAMAFIFYSLLSKDPKERPKWSLPLLCLVFVLTTLTTDGIIGKQFCYYGESLKLVTIGTLFIIPLLMLHKPKRGYN